MLKLLINSMLQYTPEDGAMEPNGEFFKEKLEVTEEQKTDQNSEICFKLSQSKTI